jgi:hypothetical protein
MTTTHETDQIDRIDHPPAHDHHMAPVVTRPQLVVVTILTVLALALGIALPASQVNLGLSGHDVGGLVMPPGMITTADTTAEAMRDMAAVDPHTVTTEAPAAARGDQPLAPHLESGVKVFDLAVAVTGWHILPDRKVEAYASTARCPAPGCGSPKATGSASSSTTSCPSRPASTGTG